MFGYAGAEYNNPNYEVLSRERMLRELVAGDARVLDIEVDKDGSHFTFVVTATEDVGYIPAKLDGIPIIVKVGS